MGTTIEWECPEELRPSYLDDPAQWSVLADVLRERGHFGFDTEYSGVGKNQSCVGRARVHVWSVAVSTGRPSPRGHSHCRGWMLPGGALEFPALKAVLEDPTIRKDIHNAGVDEHASNNHGVKIRGVRNTLGYIRWQRPELVNEPGRFKLKALMRSMLGRDPVCTFKELVADERTVQVQRPRKKTVKGCSCGAVGCRKRKTDGVRHDKWKRQETFYVTEEKVEKFDWPLEAIVPGHSRFNRLKRYSIEDSVAAFQAGEIADQADHPAPFPFGGKRPNYTQAVEDAFTAMEAVGFHRDKAYCTEKAALADKMEEEELRWLFRWFTVNAPLEGPFHRTLGFSSKGAKTAGVDSIWSSVPKLLRLFDALEFPRSPIWKKGRVKKGQVKLDEVALAWIGKNEPGAAKLVGHIINLKRIRSGRKYLVKLRDADDLVHIIAGPSSDDDERAGAVTGRAGIKGPLEAQQLPSPENADKDLFQVRKAIIAGPGEELIVADYSSLEMGLQGDLCLRLFGDRQIIEMYEAQARGVDMHSNNARNVFGRWLGWVIPPSTKVDGKMVPCELAGQTADAIPVETFKKHPFGKKLRAMIKAIWYGLAYGKGAYGFSTLEGADGNEIGEALAQKMVDALLDAVPGMRKWFEWVKDFVRKFHGIYSLGGRWCDLALEMEQEDEWIHNRAFRRAFNFPMQASGADIIGDAMVRIVRCPFLRALGFRLCLQVHDELVLRGPKENTEEAMEYVREHMLAATANGVALVVALQVSVGRGFNYYEAK